MKGASPTARVLIATALLLTPWNQAASTNEWDTSAGLSCNCFWVSSGLLMNHTTKHLGHRRLLSAHRFATKDKKKAAAPRTAQRRAHTHPLRAEGHSHHLYSRWKVHMDWPCKKIPLPLWMAALPSSLSSNLSPHLAHTKITKKTNIFYSQDQYKQYYTATSKTMKSYSKNLLPL